MDGQGRDAEGDLASRPWRGLRKISSCGEKRRQIWDVWRQESRLWEGEERSGIPAESGEQQPQRGAAAGSESESTAGALPSSILPLLPQTRQLTDLRTQDTAGATAGLTVSTPGTPSRASPARPSPSPAHGPSFPSHSPWPRG